jgi:D-alanyl-lipoteichoic acid acyltransferase DltB (MBOAT superfamily)
MITMLLGGLWHGAALHFIAWGAYHGFLLMLSGRKGGGVVPCGWWITVRRQVVCFHLIVLGWLLFRVQDFPNLVQYIESLARNGMGTQFHGLFYMILGLAITLHIVPMEKWKEIEAGFLRFPVPLQAGAYALLLILYCGFTLESPAFIYFQF